MFYIYSINSNDNPRIYTNIINIQRQYSNTTTLLRFQTQLLLETTQPNPTLTRILTFAHPEQNHLYKVWNISCTLQKNTKIRYYFQCNFAKKGSKQKNLLGWVISHSGDNSNISTPWSPHEKIFLDPDPPRKKKITKISHHEDPLSFSSLPESLSSCDLPPEPAPNCFQANPTPTVVYCPCQNHWSPPHCTPNHPYLTATTTCRHRTNNVVVVAVIKNNRIKRFYSAKWIPPPRIYTWKKIIKTIIWLWVRLSQAI